MPSPYEEFQTDPYAEFGGQKDLTQETGKGTPLEEAISPTGGEDNFLTSPHGLIRTGTRQIVHGIGEVFHPGQRMQGASDVIRGGGKMLTPAAIPLAVANPVTAAIGMGAGTVGGKLAHAGLDAAGASEGAQNLGEDVVGLGSGIMAGGMAHPRLSPAIGVGIKTAAPGVAGGGAMIGAGEALAKVPGMEWPARIGLGYPGARQIGNSLKSGFEASKENFRVSKPIPPSPGASSKWSGDVPPNGQSPGPVGPIGKPVLPSGRTPGPVPQEPPTRYQAPHQELLDQVNGDFESSPLPKPQLPSGRLPGPVASPVPQSRGGPNIPQTNTPQDIPVGPLPKPALPSGRTVGRPGIKTAPVPSANVPGTQGPGNAQAPPPSPVEAANKDTHVPGTTQADEFLPPKGVTVPVGVPPPNPTSPGPAQQPGPQRVDSPSEIKHKAYTDTKHENIRNYVSDEKNGITPEFLNKLRDDITQVDDPQLQAHAIQIAKNLGADVGRHAVKNGNPSSKYGTFNLQDINIALKHLKSKSSQ